MKYYVKLMWLVLLYGSLNAQDGLKETNSPENGNTSSSAAISSPLALENLKPLKIGDKVPDLLFKEMVNHNSTTAKLSDFRGKLIILDFWSTSCALCIAQFPKLNVLQSEFNDQLKIITIGFDGLQEGSISQFIKKRRGTKFDLKIATAIQSKNDTLLQKLFPFTGMPHEIWINSEGYLIGVTDQRSLTDYNIRSALSGGSLQNKSKLKKIYIREKDKFLINNSEFTTPSNYYGSLISKYRPDIISGWMFGLQYDSTIYRFFDVNQTVFDYYARAYRKLYPWVNKKRIVVEPNGKQFYEDWPKNANDTMYARFASDNLFNYELILPRSKFSMTEAYEYLIKDLDLKFNTKSEIALRVIKYLALIRRDSRTVPKSSTANTFTVMRENLKIEKELSMKGDSISTLVTHLGFITDSDLIILDDTGINYLIDIEINFKESSLDYIRQQLWKYNLDLVEKEKAIPMLVLQMK